MGKLVEIKEKLKNFYAENENFLKPVWKFILVFASLVLIRSNINYMPTINSWSIILVISVLLAFAPWGFNMIVISGFICANVFSASLELGIMILLTVGIMMLMFFRFTPEQAAFLIIIPFAFFLNVPYIIPIAAGLLFTPVSVVSVAFGTVIFFMLRTISISVVKEANMSKSSANVIINNIGADKQMIIMLVAFTITLVVVYLIRRMSTDYSWAIAIVVGSILEFLTIMVGNTILLTNIAIPGLIIGSVISLIIAFILQFFVFSVDYQRTEHTQFEDDEYYYYVKAVPKVNVSAPQLNVKKINAQRKRKRKI